MMAPGFYHMDCMDGMKQFPDKYFDLAVVDPPYGINVGQQSMGCGGASRLIETGQRPICAPGGATSNQFRSETNQSGGGLCLPPKIYEAFDDSHTPDAEYFKELERVAKHRIIFGGNYFLDFLGKTECLIVWDKRRRGMNFADCEVAWTDFEQPCRIFEFKWNGMLQEDMKNKEQRIHPTQKPVRLYEWIINKFSERGNMILDTHVGSGSSLIACSNLKRQYVGFEISDTYYDLASKRIAEETAQMNIFDFINN